MIDRLPCSMWYCGSTRLPLVALLSFDYINSCLPHVALLFRLPITITEY